MSQDAADFVADIDRALAEASEARGEAQETIDDTEFIVTAVQTSLEKVLYIISLIMTSNVLMNRCALLSGSE